MLLISFQNLDPAPNPELVALRCDYAQLKADTDRALAKMRNDMIEMECRYKQQINELIIKNNELLAQCESLQRQLETTH